MKASAEANKGLNADELMKLAHEKEAAEMKEREAGRRVADLRRVETEEEKCDRHQ